VVLSFAKLAFDPDSNLPPYSLKFHEKNLQHVKHMFVPGIKMSTVQWQNNLRPLQMISRKTKKKEKGNE
jgi:hypothetical protein